MIVTMRMGRVWRGWVVGVLAGGLVGGACGLGEHRTATHGDDDDTPAFSAARLGDPGESVLELLAPEEREAVRRSQILRPGAGDPGDPPPADESAPAAPGADQPQGRVAHSLDTAGRVSVSLLAVGLSAAAAAAPFLLF